MPPQRPIYKQLAKRLLNIEASRIGTFHAACAWFHDMEALDDNDMELIIRGLSLRNDFAHELYKWILDDRLPRLSRQFINGPINLYFKISNWWMCNIETGIMPEDFEHYNGEEMRGATAVNVHVLQTIVDKVLPDTK